MRVRAAIAILGLLGACGDVPTDETPRGAVRLFIAAMERSEHDPSALRDAYALLSAPTQRALQERAHATLGGEELEPWDMLVRGRFRLSFTPHEGSRGMRERIHGPRATVVVSGSGRRAEVPLVREDGRWRIVLELPPFRE